MSKRTIPVVDLSKFVEGNDAEKQAFVNEIGKIEGKKQHAQRAAPQPQNAQDITETLLKLAMPSQLPDTHSSNLQSPTQKATPRGDAVHPSLGTPAPNAPSSAQGTPDTVRRQINFHNKAVEVPDCGDETAV